MCSVSYGKTCEQETGSQISPIPADNQELLVPPVRVGSGLASCSSSLLAPKQLFPMRLLFAAALGRLLRSGQRGAVLVAKLSEAVFSGDTFFPHHVNYNKR